MFARLAIAPRSEILEAQNDPGHALLTIESDDALRQIFRLGDLSLGEIERENAFEQNRVLRIFLEGIAQVGRRNVVVSLFAGGASGQITAGEGRAGIEFGHRRRCVKAAGGKCQRCNDLCLHG
ncbi:MAG: hypothetical protein HC855_07650 [Rhizobiales bacterium]|nr:hypothetical protein [Hyphomicrobiales bacterium]